MSLVGFRYRLAHHPPSSVIVSVGDHEETLLLDSDGIVRVPPETAQVIREYKDRWEWVPSTAAEDYLVPIVIEPDLAEGESESIYVRTPEGNKLVEHHVPPEIEPSTTAVTPTPPSSSPPPEGKRRRR